MVSKIKFQKQFQAIVPSLGFISWKYLSHYTDKENIKNVQNNKQHSQIEVKGLTRAFHPAWSLTLLP